MKTKKEMLENDGMYWYVVTYNDGTFKSVHRSQLKSAIDRDDISDIERYGRNPGKTGGKFPSSGHPVD